MVNDEVLLADRPLLEPALEDFPGPGGVARVLVDPAEPLVSVGLPVRNGEGYLGDAVRSVLDQDHGRLELVISELQDRGIPARNVQVLSGFRTPQYNLALGDRSGRARDSRHQYGDAADIFIDSNHDGRMDDLNGDGRVNMADVRVILAAVERVESRYPDLVGGTGLYHSTGSHGPFAHIDVRGNRARWTSGARVARSSRRGKKSRSSRSASSKSAGKKVAATKASRSKGQ